MYPASSVIFFTALTGIGFGLLAWLGIGNPNVTGSAAFFMFLMGYGFCLGGIGASVYHLGNPKNAPKSFSQWRTSWLSREAVLAVAALLVLAPYAFGLVFLDGAPALLGWIGAALSLAMVFSTSMIYAQLKTIPRWSSPATPVLFLGYALAGGALLAGQTKIATVLLVFVAIVQIAAWTLGDRRFSEVGATLETATGLAAIGKVRLLEPPHSGENYLLTEMVCEIGRKHAVKLRFISFGLAFALPLLVLLMMPLNFFWLAFAAISHLTGVLASRWLFFAEARHVVSLYYGK